MQFLWSFLMIFFCPSGLNTIVMNHSSPRSLTQLKVNKQIRLFPTLAFASDATTPRTKHASPKFIFPPFSRDTWKRAHTDTEARKARSRHRRPAVCERALPFVLLLLLFFLLFFLLNQETSWLLGFSTSRVGLHNHNLNLATVQGRRKEIQTNKLTKNSPALSGCR